MRERYVPRIRHSEAQLAAAAPLLCAGITTYSPLRHWNVGPGHKVGVVGTGGLGHMGIKLARAMGAHEVAISRHADEMAARVRSLDCILNIVAAPHDLDPYFALLKRDGAMAAGRRARHAASVAPGVQPIMKRRSLAGCMIGGIPETQEMLDLCAERGIVAGIEMTHADEVNQAYERMLKGGVKYRFVIDIASRGARRAQACGQLPRSSNVQAVARFFDLGWLTVQTLDKASQPALVRESDSSGSSAWPMDTSANTASWKSVPHSPVMLDEPKKIPTDEGWDFGYWWSRGELNPRPQALRNQFYMRSRPIWI